MNPLASIFLPIESEEKSPHMLLDKLDRKSDNLLTRYRSNLEEAYSPETTPERRKELLSEIDELQSELVSGEILTDNDVEFLTDNYKSELDRQEADKERFNKFIKDNNIPKKEAENIVLMPSGCRS